MWRRLIFALVVLSLAAVRPRRPGGGGGDGDAPGGQPRDRDGAGGPPRARVPHVADMEGAFVEVQTRLTAGRPTQAGAGTPTPRRPGSGPWPPPGPTGPKPALGAPGAAEWRYERYRENHYRQGGAEDTVLPYDQWRQRYYDPTVDGGRPGRRGGPAQVAAKELLGREGVQQVENVRLGPQFVDGVRPNGRGGTDYFEVGKMTEGGLPVSRERVKLANETPALGPNDTLTFVDEANPSRRITYGTGDNPHAKVLAATPSTEGN